MLNCLVAVVFLKLDIITEEEMSSEFLSGWFSSHGLVILQLKLNILYWGPGPQYVQLWLRTSTSTIMILYNDGPTWVHEKERQAKEFGLEKDCVLVVSMAC